ncbi:hypothetical protein ACFL43_01035 [Thermodesulfobacteriota bacterium]
MSIVEVLQKGAEYTNRDEAAREMLADFTDHKVGMQLDDTAVTLVVKDSVVSLEEGMREDCHVAISLTTQNMCGAIDDSFDLMEIKDKGEILKGDVNDSGTAVHFMATFPFFDAMVRLYQDDPDFKKMVDDIKSSV